MTMPPTRTVAPKVSPLPAPAERRVGLLPESLAHNTQAQSGKHHILSHTKARSSTITEPRHPPSFKAMAQASLPRPPSTKDRLPLVIAATVSRPQACLASH